MDFSTFKGRVLGASRSAKALICLKNQARFESIAQLNFSGAKTKQAGDLNDRHGIPAPDRRLFTDHSGDHLPPSGPSDAVARQDFDLGPKFPRLLRFLDFWVANLDGPLYRVRVTHRRLIGPQEFR